MQDMQDARSDENTPGATVSRPLRTATYLLRFTQEEKEGLEQRVREAAAAGKTQLTLADALRGGAELFLDDFMQKLHARDGEGDGVLDV